MNLNSCIFVNNDCYKRGATIQPKGVMWHSTGANNPELKRYVQPDDGRLGYNKYQNHWNRSGLDVCVHAFIGKLADGTVATYQTLPWNRRGWHAGRGSNGLANDTHISFEICEDALTDAAYFDAVYKEGVELTAQLCAWFELDPLADGVVIDHAEGSARGIASNHGDVSHWLKRHGKTMNDVRRAVDYYMAHGYHEDEAPTQEQGEKKEGNEMRYNTLADLKADEHFGGAYLPTVEKLIAKGILKGKGGEGDGLILDLGEDAVRLLVVLDRTGAFGG